MKKVISFVLCLAIIFGSFASVFAADTAIGSDLRLSKTTGTVSVKKSSGATVKTKDNMKLYNGYTVKTAEKSYAYISLDANRAIKLDASTEVEITKSGKKLEVLIVSGEIFFNIEEKLADDETLNIRSNTIVTGIRGTAGQMNGRRVILLSGKTVVTSTSDNTEYPVEGGYIFTLKDKESEEPGQQGGPEESQEQPGTQEEPGQESPEQMPPQQEGEYKKIENLISEISGSTAKEISEDKNLSKKLTEEYGKEAVEEVSQKAEEKIAEDEKKAEEEKQAEVEKKKEEEITDSFWLEILTTDDNGDKILKEDEETEQETGKETEIITVDAKNIVEKQPESYYDDDPEPAPQPQPKYYSVTVPQDLSATIYNPEGNLDRIITFAAFTVSGAASYSNHIATVKEGDSLEILMNATATDIEDLKGAEIVLYDDTLIGEYGKLIVPNVQADKVINLAVELDDYIYHEALVDAALATDGFTYVAVVNSSSDDTLIWNNSKYIPEGKALDIYGSLKCYNELEQISFINDGWFSAGSNESPASVYFNSSLDVYNNGEFDIYPDSCVEVDGTMELGENSSLNIRKEEFGSGHLNLYGKLINKQNNSMLKFSDITLCSDFVSDIVNEGNFELDTPINLYEFNLYLSGGPVDVCGSSFVNSGHIIIDGGSEFVIPEGVEFGNNEDGTILISDGSIVNNGKLVISSQSIFAGGGSNIIINNGEIIVKDINPQYSNANNIQNNETGIITVNTEFENLAVIINDNKIVLSGNLFNGGLVTGSGIISALGEGKVINDGGQIAFAVNNTVPEIVTAEAVLMLGKEYAIETDSSNAMLKFSGSSFGIGLKPEYNDGEYYLVTTISNGYPIVLSGNELDSETYAGLVEEIGRCRVENQYIVSITFNRLNSYYNGPIVIYEAAVGSR